MEGIQFTILSGNKEVFKEGTVITFQEEGITFKIKEVAVELIFEKDTSVKEPSLKVENSENQRTLRLKLLNFDNPLGTATTKPLPIGTINGKVLFLNFCVHSIGATSQKTVHYSFYFDKEVANDE